MSKLASPKTSIASRVVERYVYSTMLRKDLLSSNTPSKDLASFTFVSRSKDNTFRFTAGTKPWDVTIQLEPKKTMAYAWVRAKCTCPAWRYKGSEWHSQHKDYAIEGLETPVDEPKNPNNNKFVCKHVTACLQSLGKYKRSPVTAACTFTSKAKEIARNMDLLSKSIERSNTTIEHVATFSKGVEDLSMELGLGVEDLRDILAMKDQVFDPALLEIQEHLSKASQLAANVADRVLESYVSKYEDHHVSAPFKPLFDFNRFSKAARLITEE